MPQISVLEPSRTRDVDSEIEKMLTKKNDGSLSPSKKTSPMLFGNLSGLTKAAVSGRLAKSETITFIFSSEILPKTETMITLSDKFLTM